MRPHHDKLQDAHIVPRHTRQRTPAGAPPDDAATRNRKDAEDDSERDARPIPHDTRAYRQLAPSQKPANG
jgi:hypothetical protein